MRLAEGICGRSRKLVKIRDGILAAEISPPAGFSKKNSDVGIVWRVSKIYCTRLVERVPGGLGFAFSSRRLVSCKKNSDVGIVWREGAAQRFCGMVSFSSVLSVGR